MRKSIGISAALLVILSIVFCCGGRANYVRHKQKRLINQAQKFVAVSDWRNASLSARQALALNNQNVAACQLLAQIAEETGNPQAMEWRRRIAEISPAI